MTQVTVPSRGAGRVRGADRLPSRPDSAETVGHGR